MFLEKRVNLNLFRSVSWRNIMFWKLQKTIKMRYSVPRSGNAPPAQRTLESSKASLVNFSHGQFSLANSSTHRKQVVLAIWTTLIKCHTRRVHQLMTKISRDWAKHSTINKKINKLVQKRIRQLEHPISLLIMVAMRREDRVWKKFISER